MLYQLLTEYRAEISISALNPRIPNRRIPGFLQSRNPGIMTV